MDIISRPNPNGANGFTSDPREQVCWDFFIEGLSKGIKNAYDSAIKANYSEDAARNITTRKWFKDRLEKLKRKEMLSDAEKVLRKTLKYKTEREDGEIKTDLLRVQTDVAKHVTLTLGKDEGYSTKSNINVDGKLETILTKEQLNEILNRGARETDATGEI